jgi:hypothetical protein
MFLQQERDELLVILFVVLLVFPFQLLDVGDQAEDGAS